LEPGGLVLDVGSQRRGEQEGTDEASEADVVRGQIFDVGIHVADAVRLRDLLAGHLQVAQRVAVGLAHGGEAL